MAFRPHPVPSPALVFAAAAVVFLAAPASVRAASPTEQYLQARQNYPPRPNLTLAGAARDPDAVRGATLEVTGRLLGLARTDEGASLMVDTGGAAGVLNLTMSRVPDWVQNGSRLRALCVIGGARQNGVMIGMPELLVVAVASESDIAVAEVRWEKQRLARAADSKRYRADLQRLASLYASGKIRLPGRGGSSPRASAGAFRGTLLASRNASAPRGSDSAAVSADVFGQYRAFIRASNVRLSERQVDDITTAILRSSEQMDVDPRLIVALIIAESSFDPGATSRTGAMGLGQIMPGTAAEIGLTNPYDPVQNIQGAVYLLKTRLDKYSGNAAQGDLQMRHIHLALAAYNAGMGAVKRYNGIPPYRETRNYIKKIERLYRQLCGEGDTAPPSSDGGAGAGGAS